MGDENEENMSKKKEIKYNELTDRQLLLYSVETVNKIEEEKEQEIIRMKKEIKQEIKVELKEKRRVWEQKSVELKDRINKKLKEWEEKHQRKEQRQQSKKEIKKENGKKSEIEKKIRIMEKRCEKQEAGETRKCIVIRGLQKDKRGLEKEMKEFFKTKMETEVKVQQASILGLERKVIWMKFGTLEDKKEIMEWKKRLGQELIYIGHDRKREERDIKREIV